MKKIGIIISTMLLLPTMLFADTLINYNGQKGEVSSVIKNNTTYVGIRDLGDATGLAVMYHDDTSTLELLDMTTTMSINLETGDTRVNGEPVTSAPLLTVKGRTYLPLRFVCEKFDYVVDTNGNTVNITNKPTKLNAQQRVSKFETELDTLASALASSYASIYVTVQDIKLNNLDEDTYTELLAKSFTDTTISIEKLTDLRLKSIGNNMLNVVKAIQNNSQKLLHTKMDSYATIHEECLIAYEILGGNKTVYDLTWSDYLDKLNLEQHSNLED